ncbi:nitrite reductase large subunit NirB [Marinicellulosiphila megalodicopiae]|uniref:nitrite reductase large subunit NirB n=1 Tax=Marinicellulosiphila megalodicopiae TaxID=2724896 RepID=UPI003BB14505
MTRIVVVGNGMVGHHFIDQLVQSEKDFKITTFCEESKLAYDRVQLSAVFSGKTEDDLMMTSEAYYQENNVEYFINEKVISIDRANKTVTTDKGQTLGYDKLVLATGSYPFVPPVPGHEKEHCHVYRTFEDLAKIRASAADSKSGVVIGGGLLGLEAANAVKNLGVDTHVVEFAPRLMAVQLDEGGGNLLRSKIEALGVQVHTGKNTQEIADGTTSRYTLKFADGETLDTDMLVFSAGIRPQDELARLADIEIGPRGGITINNQCQTSDQDIYAIGECALWDGKIFGLVAPGYSMSKVAAANIQEETAAFEGADMSTKLKLLGIDVCSIGDAHAQSEGAKSYTLNNEGDGVYKKIVTNEAGDKLIGAVLVGESEDYGTWLQLCLNETKLPCSASQLLVPSNGAVMEFDVPDTAVICSCYDVTKGDIVAAVQGGAATMGDIKSGTQASTGCGGCAALVLETMNKELMNLGVEVSTDICQHFKYSRQELADIVRVKEIKTFKELLHSHGDGHGCEICRPAVGSILASFWNEYILAEDHIGLQETNDVFLGNIQKDGTYSVVPRIPGGELTPDQLIVLGQVGKEYNLYTKITGGQRVDFFGAQLHELPPIWKKLIDAGFETGHAYGKSLRTVKSCVGSTWCRYGVLDSVGFAIELEDRYKGMRTPHKVKMAVSGCTRECAEAQSKDVGVIATETGWALYVCGNGGMKPRHADLLATGLTNEELITLVDRFYMFYIRTADRLQRTSKWMDAMEGGLDYLKEVIIEDKLGICAELESDMQRNIDNYQCEWKTTLETPKALARFSHFVNSTESDPAVSFELERGQIKPAELIPAVNVKTEDPVEA